MKKIILLLLFFSLTVSAAFCEPANRPLVVNDANIGSVEQLTEDKNSFPFIVLQTTEHSRLSNKNINSLLSYVKDGGTLWFYDSRIAGKFGMKNAPMKIEGLETKGMKAEFGSGKMSGAAIGAEAQKGTPAAIGVRRLAVFALLIGDNQYSAVAPDGVIPLLRVPKQTSLIGAVKIMGKGKIIFKPLLWEEQYDGASFQRKLIRYSIFTPSEK